MNEFGLHGKEQKQTSVSKAQGPALRSAAICKINPASVLSLSSPQPADGMKGRGIAESTL